MLSRFSGFVKNDWPYLIMGLFVLSVTVFALLPEKGHHDKKHAAQSSAAAGDILDQKAFKESQEKMLKLFNTNLSLYLAFFALNLLIIVLILSGIFLDIMIFQKMRNTGADPSPLLAPTLPHRPARWGIGDVARFAVIFYTFAYLFMIAESFWLRVYKKFDNDNFLLMLNATVTDVMGILFVLYYVTVIRGHTVDSIGLTLKNFFRNVMYGIAGYIAVIPPLVATLIITVIVLQIFHLKPPVQPIVDILIKEKKVPMLVYSSLFAAIAGPIMEEIVFRGFMYKAFKERWGIFWGIMITSALFSLLHGHLVGFVPILILGILLAYLYEKTGSLVPSMTVHITHNLASLALVFSLKV